MAPTPYGEVLARRIRSARAAKRLGQESLATRMQALGFDGWTRQTVGSTEKPTRRVTAAEVVGLALALETSVPTLLAAVPDDEAVAFPDGELTVESITKLVTGINDHSVTWEDDKPVFARGQSAWWVGQPGASKDVQEVLDKSREAED
jgi:transcriptional regulator with XRE-family HTH domain